MYQIGQRDRRDDLKYNILYPISWISFDQHSAANMKQIVGRQLKHIRNGVLNSIQSSLCAPKQTVSSPDPPHTLRGGGGGGNSERRVVW